jgi:hypothetical protein
MDRDDIVAKVEKYIAALVSGKYEGVAFIVDDASVCLLIDFEAKNGTVVPMADYIELSDGKIVSIRPFYDPRPLLEIERV